MANDMAGGFGLVDDVFGIWLEVVRHVTSWRCVGPVEPERMYSDDDLVELDVIEMVVNAHVRGDITNVHVTIGSSHPMP